jgi:hypothetical protein
MRLVVENLSKEYRGNGQAVQAFTRVQLALGPGVLSPPPELLGNGPSFSLRIACHRYVMPTDLEAHRSRRLFGLRYKTGVQPIGHIARQFHVQTTSATG